MTGPGGGQNGTLDERDLRLLALIRELYADADPMPEQLVANTLFAIEVDAIEVELARPVPNRELAGAGSRGVEEIRHVTFESDSLTILIAVGANEDGSRHIDGWLTPGRVYPVELRTTAGVYTADSDERGRFFVDHLPRGTVQLVVRVDDVAVISPAMVL